MTMIIMFAVINEITRKPKPGSPQEKKKCRILAKGKKLRGINKEC